jgi:hypothetical protein
MHHKASPRSDRGTQRTVLALALAAHPQPLSILDLAREIDQGDAVERAIRDLVGVGLLECGGVSIQPSAAAIHFDWLELP